MIFDDSYGCHSTLKIYEDFICPTQLINATIFTRQSAPTCPGHATVNLTSYLSRTFLHGHSPWRNFCVMWKFFRCGDVLDVEIFYILRHFICREILDV